MQIKYMRNPLCGSRACYITGITQSGWGTETNNEIISILFDRINFTGSVRVKDRTRLVVLE